MFRSIMGSVAARRQAFCPALFPIFSASLAKNSSFSTSSASIITMATPTSPSSTPTKNTTSTTTTTPTTGPTFTSLGLPSHLLGRLQRMKNIHRPTAVQQAALPSLLANLDGPVPDTVLHAETGTGKTLAYLLPLFARLEPRIVPHARLRAIIVTPTRELSLQVSEVAEALGSVGNKKTPEEKETKTVRVRRVVGEASAQLLHELKTNPPHILIGTPGTLAALIPAHVNTGELQALVLDEVDELLRSHSVTAVSALLKSVHRHGAKPGVIAVSATSSFALQKLTSETLRKSTQTIDLTQGLMSTPSTLSHYVLRIPNPTAAYNMFTRFLAAARPPAILSFHSTANSLEALEAHLRAKGVPVVVLANAYTNAQRAKALESIRSGRVKVLLATEMAARGLDLPRISHVVNFDLPSSLREYVHRAGRAGRVSSLTPGRAGYVITFVSSDEETAQTIEMARELGVGLEDMSFEQGQVVVSPLLVKKAPQQQLQQQVKGEGTAVGAEGNQSENSNSRSHNASGAVAAANHNNGIIVRTAATVEERLARMRANSKLRLTRAPSSIITTTSTTATTSSSSMVGNAL